MIVRTLVTVATLAVAAEASTHARQTTTPSAPRPLAHKPGPLKGQELQIYGLHPATASW